MAPVTPPSRPPPWQARGEGRHKQNLTNIHSVFVGQKNYLSSEGGSRGVFTNVKLFLKESLKAALIRCNESELIAIMPLILTCANNGNV